MTAARRPISLAAPASPLNPVELIDYTRFVAGEVAAGRYPYIEYNEETRWHQRIYRDPRVDVWLISWLPSQGTQLHDHGGSSGAFTVLSGELSEAIYRPGRPADLALLEHRRPSGASVGFGSRYVHDVRNLCAAPAVSIHAYSPPLSSMNYYDIGEGGGLDRIATLATDDPEPAVELVLGRPAA